MEGSFSYLVPLVPVKAAFQQVGRQLFVGGGGGPPPYLDARARGVSGHVSVLQEPEWGSRTPVPTSPSRAEGSERARPANAGNEPLLGN